MSPRVPSLLPGLGRQPGTSPGTKLRGMVGPGVAVTHSAVGLQGPASPMPLALAGATLAGGDRSPPRDGASRPLEEQDREEREGARTPRQGASLAAPAVESCPGPRAWAAPRFHPLFWVLLEVARLYQAPTPEMARGSPHPGRGDTKSLGTFRVVLGEPPAPASAPSRHMGRVGDPGSDPHHNEVKDPASWTPRLGAAPGTDGWGDRWHQVWMGRGPSGGQDGGRIPEGQDRQGTESRMGMGTGCPEVGQGSGVDPQEQDREGAEGSMGMGTGSSGAG